MQRKRTQFIALFLSISFFITIISNASKAFYNANTSQNGANSTLYFPMIGQNAKRTFHPYLSSIGGRIENLYLHDSHLFLTHGNQLSVVSLADKTNPTLLSTIDLPNSAADIKFAEGKAYIAAHEAGLVVVDISNLSQLSPISYLPLDNTVVTGLELIGHYAYLWSAQNLSIVDIKKPHLPILHQIYPEWHGSHMLVGTSLIINQIGDQVNIIDVSIPQKPTLHSIYSPLPGMGLGSLGISHVIDDILYMDSLGCSYGACAGGIQTIDIGDPTALFLSSEYISPFIDEWNSIEFDGLVAYASRLGFLDIIDTSTPGKMTLLKSFSFENETIFHAEGGYLFTIDWEAGIQSIRIYDVGNLSVPALPLIGQFDHPSLGDVSLVINDSIFMQEMATFHIVDISNIDSPNLASTYTPPDSFNTYRVIEEVEDILYALGKSATSSLAGTNFELQLFDIQNEANPILLSSYLPQTGYGVTTVFPNTPIDIVDQTAFLLSNGELEIVDVSDPLNPQFIQNYTQDSEYYMRSIRVVDNLAYIGFQDINEIHIVDIGEPLTPTFLGKHQADDVVGFGGTFIFDIQDNLLYSMYQSQLLQIVNVTDPTTPQIVGSYLFPRNFITSATIQGDLGFFMDHGKLHILDVSNPEQPTLITTYQGPVDSAPINSIGISNEYLYIGSRIGISVFDMTDPTNLLFRFLYPNRSNSFVIGNEYLYITDYGALTIAEKYIPSFP